MEVQPYSSA